METYIKILRLYKPNGDKLEFILGEEITGMGRIREIIETLNGFIVRYDKSEASFSGFPYAVIRFLS